MNENEIDCIVADVMRKLGVDRTQPPHWVQQVYNSVAGYKKDDGFTCSFCGKHSWVKWKVCDGCKSSMRNGVQQRRPDNGMENA